MDLAAAFVALNRFGLGARPGDVAAIGADPRGWVLDQVVRGQADPVPGVQDSPGRLHAVDRFFKAKAEADRAEAAALASEGTKPAAAAAVCPPLPPPPSPPPVAAALPGAAGKPPPSPLDTPPVKFLENDIVRRAEQMTVSDRPVVERLAAFWSNHFSVSNLRGEIAVLAVPYENEAIRPFVFGTFHDMLCATAVHPAMLFYLDAATSVGPDSPVGRRRKQSINENYAREIMELHTLGVNGGYTQQDVQQLALALTGIGLDRQDGEAAWFYDRHEPGARSLLGRRLADQTDQLRGALAILANHPATIRHVCGKLAAHVCGDAPPAAVVRRLGEAWTASGGKLPAVYAALAHSPEAWVARPVKYRTPQDFVVAAARALGFRGRGRPMLQEMKLLGQMPFGAPAPTGWSDQAADWLGPAGVVGRVASAQRLAGYADPRTDPVELLPQVVPTAAASPTPDVVLTEPNPRRALAFVLASAEFQRR